MTPQVKAGLIVGRRDYHRHGAVGLLQPISDVC